MIAVKENVLTYISDSDIYVTKDGDVYNVYSKYTDAFLGFANMAQADDFIRRAMEDL